MKKLFLILIAMLPMVLWAQFAPAPGQPGTTAMHADSSAFVAWATGCTVNPGPMNITNPSAGMAGSGWPASNVIGFPEGTMGVTCLGDGGDATVTFASPICNRPGPDFAVFENGFANAQNPDMYFLELGFVEVSSDGVNFFRFPAISNVQTSTQIGGFGCIDPTQIHNLASKYPAMYGTPFELDEIPDNPLLNKNNITHVRIVDVIGTIDPEYCTYDSQGHIVNDPWPTAFASGGMDLDAVGVIHDIAHFPTPPDEPPYIANPVADVVFDEYPQTIQINLEGVVSDPDDPDEDIIYSIRSNSNEDELSATLNDKMLNLTRLSREEGTATLVIRATSNGQRIDFTINVTMHFILDNIGENKVVDVKVYPNPAHDLIKVEIPSITSKLCIKVYDVSGHWVMTSTDTEINVGTLKEGVYILHISFDNATITKRLTIKH
ncbi:MAG: T9SS type A sorting domain-containing protein [Bacteroidales bacterium]|nr:T9SS type A sorting domain-containing protein [Bacteroidales bacterium]